MPILCFPDGTAVSVVSANPTRTRLSTISAEKPSAISSASVAPIQPTLVNISSARRHWGLRGISGLTQAAHGTIQRVRTQQPRCSPTRHQMQKAVRGSRGLAVYFCHPFERPASMAAKLGMTTSPDEIQAVLRAEIHAALMDLASTSIEVGPPHH